MKRQDATMKGRAQQLRTNATPEENTLWFQYLRRATPQWYRQRVIGTYIADFYCKQCKIVVELDGGEHYTPHSMCYDATRSAYFEASGILVLRFTNTDIHQRLREVCDVIDRTVQQRLSLA